MNLFAQRRVLKRFRVTVCVCTVALLVGGCASGGLLNADGLAFRQDNSIVIIVPGERELVSEPLSVEWTMEPTTDQVAGFMLFVDRGPQPPGKTIEYFKQDNRSNIYLAETSPFEIPAIERREAVAKKVRDQHHLTIIAIDVAGRRIGETAAYVDFDVFEEEL